ncbi:MAG: M6 family metalloprotease domain-containing protein [Gemmatimonadetes bacterium]|nr:M6 family metalloprotease domain-containing protein [Gemmatimonadota bacterium]
MNRRLVLVVVLAALAVPGHDALAQGAQDARRREPPGFDFSPDGVWRVRARQVRAQRARALSRGDFAALNAPVAMRAAVPSPLAVTGVLRTPVLLVRYRNTDTTTLRAPSQYADVLVGATAPSGMPYTLRTFYEELSSGLFSVQGQVIGWTTLDSNDTFYEGACNGLRGYCTNPRTGNLMQEALTRADSTLDFGQFDNDGPDGVPNSGDDNGTVDLATFIFPEVDGACGTTNIWAHKDQYRFWFGGVPFATNDARAGGGFIQVNDYTIQSGLGSPASDRFGCAGTDIMGLGTIGHEFGHGLGLPDLYDTNPNDEDDSEGIGEWGLMGSGGYAVSRSPAHMESWSRNQLGWVTLRALTSNGTFTFGPTTSMDTVLLVRPGVLNTRGEFFLLENRQSVLSDTGLIRLKGPGLLIWHVDSTKYAQNFFSNTVNSGSIHAVWLMQADGFDQLRSSTQGIRNRGDAGDPYPGTSGNVTFSFFTSPSATLNANGAFVGFAVDSIRQVVAGGEMAFRLRFGGSFVASASDTNAQIRVRGTALNTYRDVLPAGDTVTVSADSVQADAAGRTQYVFTGWSDAGARTHVVTGSGANLTLTAQITRRFLVSATVVGSGAIAASPSIDLASGTLVSEPDSVVLTATPSAGNVFAGWTGDTTAFRPRLVLRARRPFAVTASFALLALDSVVAQLTRGTGLTLGLQTTLDRQGNDNGSFDLGDVVAWLDQSRTAVSAEVRARLLGRAGP